MKVHAPVGFCVLAMGLLIPAVKAGTITIAGTGFQSSNRFRFDISGDDFVFRVSTSEGPLIVANCTPGVPCEIERSYPAGMPNARDLISSFASLGNVSTDLVTGRLVVLGTIITPTTPGVFQATIPIAFAGEVIGHFTGEGLPVAFDVVIGAPGSAVFGGEVIDSSLAVVNRAEYTFSGTALTESAIPEPGAMYLAAGGIGLLGLLFRRRRAMLN